MALSLTPVTPGTLSLTPVAVGSLTLQDYGSYGVNCSELLACSSSLACSGFGVNIYPLVAS